MRRAGRVRIVSVVCAVLLQGCGEEERVRPPTIHYGADLCLECGMIVSDERFAAGLVLLEGARYEDAAFDDVGCMLQFESGASERTILARYVHDHETLAWLEAGSAVFVHCPQLPTPMASGVAAFAEDDAASAFMERCPGERLGLATLRRRHAEGVLRTAMPAPGSGSP